MQLAKTDKGREALLHRDPRLSALDRRILIVSDGRRNIDDLVSLLGDGVTTSLERLLQEGYLEASASTATTRPDTAGGTVSLLLRRSIASPEKEQEPAQSARSTATGVAPSTAGSASDTDSVAIAAAAPAATRRSLAASRMYMLDMLQRLRSDEAKAHTAAIRATQGDQMVASLVAALRHIHAGTSASYAQRVSERLGEVLPAEYLPQLESVAMEQAILRTG